MFYQRLKAACEMRNIAISAAVKATLPSVGVIDNWKKGGAPRVDAVIKLATYLEVTTDYLLGLSEIPEPAKQQEGELSVDEAKLIDRLRRADAHTQMNVMKMAWAVLPQFEDVSER